VNASFLFLLFGIIILANDEGGTLAWRAGLDEEALVGVVEVNTDTAAVVDASRLTVGDRRRLVCHSTRHVAVCHRLPHEHTASTSAAACITHIDLAVTTAVQTTCNTVSDPTHQNGHCSLSLTGRVL